jgi:hypothetical protein
MIIKNKLDSNMETLSIFGKVGVWIMMVITCIVSFSLAVVENIFIIPCWLIYNLCHKKESRKSYAKFLNLED